ncbi:MAG: M23 family metallopeptidase [Bdellovibrionales bacterium]|nr:M23 family metallopeptidase [Bdellovibrionales bacterium]
MIWFMIIVTVFSHIVLPFMLLAWVAFNKGGNRVYRLSVGLLVGAFLLTMWKAGAGWHWLGAWWPILFLVLYVPAAAMLDKNLRQVPMALERSFRPGLSTVLTFALALFFVSDLPTVLMAANYEGEAISLKFPLRQGTYHVGHGVGAAMNYHFEVEAQKFALDIMKVNEYGTRASGLMPINLQAFEIFGDKLVAPCSGEVILSKDGLIDNAPLQMDPENLLGNSVVIFCSGHSVLLAHLKNGSVVVKTGESVEEGQVIGEVGNSGNTTEPHLHIHAVKGKKTSIEELAGSSTGVPMLFDGQFLIRNDRVTYVD